MFSPPHLVVLSGQIPGAHEVNKLLLIQQYKINRSGVGRGLWELEPPPPHNLGALSNEVISHFKTTKK